MLNFSNIKYNEASYVINRQIIPNISLEMKEIFEFMELIANKNGITFKVILRAYLMYYCLEELMEDIFNCMENFEKRYNVVISEINKIIKNKNIDYKIREEIKKGFVLKFPQNYKNSDDFKKQILLRSLLL